MIAFTNIFAEWELRGDEWGRGCAEGNGGDCGLPVLRVDARVGAVGTGDDREVCAVRVGD
jgi:hypothetical protein